MMIATADGQMTLRPPVRGAPPLHLATGTWLCLLATLACLYFVTAKFGLAMAAMHKNVSLVWPPTGLALAGLLLFGVRLWPAIALGAFLVNVSTGVGLAVSAGIAAGNSLESLVGVYLLRRLTRFGESLERPQDVLGFVVLAGGLATTLSATIGVASLCLGGAAAWPMYGTLWWQWWLGDATGALVVSPVVLTWATQPRIAWSPKRVAEGLALLVLVIAVSRIVFGGWVMMGGIGAPPAFAVFPFAIWAAMRFGQREAATTTFVMSLIATLDTAKQVGPFAGTTPTEGFVLLQVFMSVVAVTALVLGAAIGGRRRVEAALQHSERRYRELFENATAMVYTTDLEGRFTSLNKRGEHLTGYTRDEARGIALSDLAGPDFVALAREMTARQAVETEPMLFELDITAKNGRTVSLEVSTRLITDEGRPIGVQGVARDITRHRQVEGALELANRKLSEWVNELEDRTRQITLLSEMGELLQSCLFVEEAYTVVAGFIPKLFPGQSGTLAVLGASKHLVEVVACWGEAPPGDHLFPPEQCWALRRGQTYRVDPPAVGLVCGHVDATRLAGYVCVPMMAYGEPLGVLHLRGQASPRSSDGAPEPLSESLQQLAATAAEHIALALANLRLRETLRNQSIQDPLTGLFNRRYMEETLELELARATRAGRSVAVIMLDMDHFKALNDSGGHEGGDAFLRALADLLKSRVREGDIACRFGGEEFVLILPEAPLDLAIRRGEELREAVKHLRVSHRSRIIGPITASVGIATFPDHGKTGALLVQAADAALYRAKAGGRDRVIVAS